MNVDYTKVFHAWMGQMVISESNLSQFLATMLCTNIFIDTQLNVTPARHLTELLVSARAMCSMCGSMRLAWGNTHLFSSSPGTR